MTTRATVQVFNDKGEGSSSTPLPAVFSAPIRTDVVAAVHKSIAKNRRQVGCSQCGRVRIIS